MRTKESYILLNDLKFFANHGVGKQETIVGNTFIVNLKIKTNFEDAAKTDNLEGTISYADIFESIKEEMETPSLLLEHVANRIAERLFKDFSAIEMLELKLMKQNPPMGADIDSAGVEIICYKD